MSLLHLNISPLPFHFDKFTNLPRELNSNIEIIGITETRLTIKKDPVRSIEIPNYNIEYTPTESDRSPSLHLKRTKLQN